jgi:glycerophosphoryl diester phosphodiesterase
MLNTPIDSSETGRKASDGNDDIASRGEENMGEVLIMGHRGARFEAPENTLPGFRYAVGLGLTSVEFDVRLTADNALVIIHDDTVDRTTDGSGRVADLTLSELKALDARSTFPEWPEECSIPTLAEVLDVVSVMPTIEIEIKRDEPARLERLVPLLVDEIRRRGIEAQVRITSFEPYALELAQQHAPDIRRCFIGNWDSADFLETATRLGCARAGVHHPKANHEVVTAAREQGLEVCCWPTNSPEELESALSFAPDILCTDNPTLIRELSARV